MFGIPGKDDLLEVARKAPMALAEGVVDIFTEPPKRVAALWNKFSPQDQELFKEAGMALLRIGANYAISRAKKSS